MADLSQICAKFCQNIQICLRTIVHISFLSPENTYHQLKGEERRNYFKINAHCDVKPRCPGSVVNHR